MLDYIKASPFVVVGRVRAGGIRKVVVVTAALTQGTENVEAFF